MRIISTNTPIVEDYSNFDFKNIVNKAKGLVGSGKVKGFVGNLTNKQQAAPIQEQQQAAPIPLPPKPKGMSKGLKIGLIVGGSLLVVVLTVLVIIKSKKK
jgi:hypothetical protein